jgi:glycerate kinase
LAVLAAERRPGVDVVLELTGLLSKLAGADLVITGEGSTDGQSLGGKTPVGVARAAARCSVPVIAVCGRTTLSSIALAATYSLSAREPDLQKSMANAHVLLEQIGEEIGPTYS